MARRPLSRRAKAIPAPIKRPTLSKVDIFQGLSAKEMEELAGWLHPSKFQKGDVLFREGDPSNGMYVLGDGTVSVIKGSERGHFRLATLNAPCFVGEASLLMANPRTASVKAESDVRAGFLPGSYFRRLLTEHNNTAFMIALNLARLLAERVASSNRQLALKAAKIQRNVRQIMG